MPYGKYERDPEKTARVVKAAAEGRWAALQKHSSAGPACKIDDCPHNVCRGPGGWGDPTSIYCKLHKAMDKRAIGYGTTLEEVVERWEKNNRACEICEKKLKLRAEVPGDRANSVYIDHDHASGEFRGLLCHRCNSVLGYIADNPVTAQKLIWYLFDTAGISDED